MAVIFAESHGGKFHVMRDNDDDEDEADNVVDNAKKKKRQQRPMIIPSDRTFPFDVANVSRVYYNADPSVTVFLTNSGERFFFGGGGMWQKMSKCVMPHVNGVDTKLKPQKETAAESDDDDDEKLKD